MWGAWGHGTVLDAGPLLTSSGPLVPKHKKSLAGGFLRGRFGGPPSEALIHRGLHFDKPALRILAHLGELHLDTHWSDRGERATQGSSSQRALNACGKPAQRPGATGGEDSCSGKSRWSRRSGAPSKVSSKNSVSHGRSLFMGTGVVRGTSHQEDSGYLSLPFKGLATWWGSRANKYLGSVSSVPTGALLTMHGPSAGCRLAEPT